jgi:hypothetical protein
MPHFKLNHKGGVLTSPILKPITMQISLDNHEQEIVKTIAKERQRNNIERGSRDYKVCTEDDLKINIEGTGGEFAFCKLKNIYPDMTVDHPIPFDCYINGHGYIDVKTTKYLNGDLIVGVWKSRAIPSYYALMVGEFPHYEFKGFFSGEEVFQPQYLSTKGKGPVYVIPQGILKMEL